MAVRVALLAVFTGLFVVVWSGDQPHLLADTRPMPIPTKHEPRYPTERSSDLVHAVPVEQHDAIPLPENLPGGTYLVADRFGKTRICFVVRPTDLSKSQFPMASNDHYVLDRGENRLHFIRIDSPLTLSAR